ncbi:beta-propeller fold lactonase family protein [Arthrobacter sp. E3]|uniref:lactonase family protein n=1 Tax=Arthrobacter sp. E3 TaxID=517402 RepID=UPI001A952B86|nr:beta-propeller fold lactonase family protein [Arthrobacter sp. E3]
MSSTQTLIVSGYTEEGYGAGPGLASFAVLDDGTVGAMQAQKASVPNPSFVTAGGGYLLAVEELPQGGVAAVDPQTLELVARAETGGADPCHSAFIDGRVWAANYSSGTAAMVPLAVLLAGSTQQLEHVSHPGSGPVVDRQSQSHCHQVTATPWGTVLVSDLGADRVDEYAQVGELFELQRSAQLPPGTGPRHVALKGDFMLVTGELDGHLHVLRKTRLETDIPGSADEHPAGSAEWDFFWQWLFKSVLTESPQALENGKDFFPSHVQLSADGTKIYVAVRGPNTLVVMDVGELDESVGERPSPPCILQEISCGGNWPRHFAMANNMLYVANQRSNSVTVFAVGGDGLLGAAPVQLLEFGSATCVLPL